MTEKKSIYKMIDPVYILIAISVGLAYWGFELYKRTIIDLKIMLIIILISGVVSYLIEQTKFFKTETKKISFFRIVQHVFTWGLIGGSLFLTVNYYLHSDKIKNANYEIERIGFSREKCIPKSIFVDFKYKDVTKRLKFPKTKDRDLKKYKSVSLEMTKEQFGFDIVTKQELLVGEVEK